MKPYLGAIDQGTTSTRFLIFDAWGRVVSSAQQEHKQYFPEPGWVEHNPEEILQKTISCVENALAGAKIRAGDLEGIGLTNQRETILLWDKTTGRAVYAAIVWQDTRTDEFCRRLDHEHGPRIREITGLPVVPYFSASKLRWLLDKVPRARERAEQGELLAGTIDSWLVWKLTGGPQGGVHVTDVTNASRTQLMNLKTLEWDPWLLEVFGIPATLLPTIRTSSEVYGTAQLLPGSPPLAGILGDQQAALFGQAGFEKGDAKNTYGTGCFLLMNTGTVPVISQNGLLTTVAASLPEQPVSYGLEGSVAMAGAAIQWLRDNLGLITSSSEVELLARSVHDNGGVYFVPAFSGLFAPHWRPDARGALVGLTRYATKAHLVRATLEAVAFQTRDVLEAMERDAGVKMASLKVDGGMTVNELFLQIQADVLGVRVVRPKILETTALGAAYAAGLARGFWSGLGELKTHWAVDRQWESNLDTVTRARWYAGWQKALGKSLNWVDES